MLLGYFEYTLEKRFVTCFMSFYWYRFQASVSVSKVIFRCLHVVRDAVLACAVVVLLCTAAAVLVFFCEIAVLDDLWTHESVPVGEQCWRDVTLQVGG